MSHVKYKLLALAVLVLLMFGGDAEALFRSRKVVYLLIADVLFAAYVFFGLLLEALQ